MTIHIAAIHLKALLGVLPPISNVALEVSLYLPLSHPYNNFLLSSDFEMFSLILPGGTIVAALEEITKRGADVSLIRVVSIETLAINN